MNCDELKQARIKYEETLKSMSTEALVNYTLDRDHCNPLEKELANRLKEII